MEGHKFNLLTYQVMFRKWYYALEQYSTCPDNFFDHYVMNGGKYHSHLMHLNNIVRTYTFNKFMPNGRTRRKMENNLSTHIGFQNRKLPRFLNLQV
jgi:hypothetical protein